MGSKSRIAKKIIPILQDALDCNPDRPYVEPFCGGCNVIDKIRHDNKRANDSNIYLIELLKRAQAGGCLLPTVSRETYESVRTSYYQKDGKYPLWVYGNVGFLASYNGRFFDGGFAEGGFEKTKTGPRFRDYYQEAKQNLEHQNLSEIQFSCGDYAKLTLLNSVVYCDPPYNNTKGYKEDAGFKSEVFWDVVRYWSMDNIVFVSEQTAPDDFDCVWSEGVSRSIWASNKKDSVERLFKWKR